MKISPNIRGNIKVIVLNLSLALELVYWIMKEILLNLSRALGLAYWVKIDTERPCCTYYFGPFLKAKEAEEAKIGYLEDLKQEGALGITVAIDHFKPQELTICNELAEMFDSKVVSVVGS